MKTIYIVFNDKEKISVSAELYNNLKYVFEDYIKIKTCFLDEVVPEDIADGDLFVVLYEDRVYAMKEYTQSLDKVIVVSRTIQKRFLPDIFSIPEGSKVLVVNDSPQSTRQTANTLYELGLNHINLIPYEPNKDQNIYKDIKIAITPNEALLVPHFIEKIIDVRERYVDLSTFITIISKLKINNEQITRNLIRYTQLIAETNRGVNKRYVMEHLKTEMLKRTIHDSPNAILITDHEYKIVYANDRAQVIFDIEGTSIVSIKQVFGKYARMLMKEKEEENLLLSKSGVNYMVSKIIVKVVDEVVGYSFQFIDERQIKNIENDLSKQLAKNGLVAKYTFDDILYLGEAMKKAISVAKKTALTDYTVLINGESGTGKELLAQSIHNYSDRKDKPFVAINCAALPESLLESELFGYEKGAFTGASGSGKQGLFEQAGKGTVFLDEIGDMSLHLQARLLRVLQEKQVMRLGSDKIIDMDIRIVAATNKNLREAIEQKTFREDLYYRLCNIPIVIPPLRQRKEDILYIVESFLGDSFEKLTEKECKALTEYSWPGNVRELKNTMEYYQLLGELPEEIIRKEFAESSKCEKESAPDVRDRILEIIRSNTTEMSGIGRTAIIFELQRQGIAISDDKVRKILKSLHESGEIEIGKGRKGCRAIELKFQGY